MAGYKEWRNTKSMGFEDDLPPLRQTSRTFSARSIRQTHRNNSVPSKTISFNRRSRGSNVEVIYFDVARLKELRTWSSDSIATILAQKETEFQMLINRKMNSNVFVLTIEMLTKACQANFTEIMTRILSQVCSDTFLKVLLSFIIGLCIENDGDKYNNSVYHEDKDRFWDNLNCLLIKIIDLIPRTACNKLIPIVEKALVVRKNIAMTQNYKGNENSVTTLKKIQKSLEREINKIREMSSRGGLGSRPKDRQLVTVREKQPPENFRSLNVVPTLDDLRVENPYFRPCKVKDAYDDIEHYLDVQFRLLREDFLIPLRNGLREYLSENTRYQNGDLRIYRNARIEYLDINKNNIGYKLCFGKLRSENWKQTKRFMHGSLLILSRDNFESALFATVTDCDLRNLAKGNVLIEPCEGSVITADHYKSKFVVLESKIFYEPYYQVLKAMKNIDVTNFPMETYLIQGDVRPKLPSYLSLGSRLKYKDAFTLPVGFDNLWPSSDQLKMDESQYKAFKSALTQEFAMIQGPPGTGKTYLALQVVRALLENSEHWRPYGPIVVVCLTNHALDQFLEGVLAFTDSLVRAGTRSKSDILNNYKLMERRELLGVKNKVGRTMQAVKEEIEDILAEIMKYRTIMKYLTTPNVIVPLSCLFHDYPSSNFHSDAELIYWLTGYDVNHNSTNNPETNYDYDYSEFDDEFCDFFNGADEIHNAYTDNDVKFNHDKINSFSLRLTDVMGIMIDQISFVQNKIEELENMQQTGDDQFYYEIRDEIAVCEYELDILMEHEQALAEEFKNHPLLNDACEPSRQDRWNMYWKWVISSYGYVNNKMISIEGTCRQKKIELDEYRQLANLEVFKRHEVIGLTTSCAARIQSSLRSLSAPIVIVEEAAEILESHVVCSITKECKHVILIGDHKQLRPKASVYELGLRYNLNVSLFERMVNVRGKCLQLEWQHRMRPQISKLIRPSIYEILYDHDIVRDYPGVRGLDKNLFFIDHDVYEKSYNKEDTWMNEHEVEFLLAFAKHLLLQGYESSEITILCTYSGQLHAFTKSAADNELLKGVCISTVDNFQGEENKIILLSLVRNNGRGNIGFLKEENRVCVALSRAKEGLYIMGNIEDLIVKNKIWPQIRDVLEEDESIGDTLELRCQIHHDQVFQIKTAEDFQQCPEGGCSKRCNALLDCGHLCVSVCHILNREHDEYQCKENCKLQCPKGHPCPLKCWEDCGLCKVKVPKLLPCGHIVNVSCYKDPKSVACPVKVNVILPDCLHSIDKPCYKSINECTCTHDCEISLACGHECAGKCHVRSDPNHCLYNCLEDCKKKSVDCKNDHLCQNRCSEICQPCSVVVKKIRSCGHVYSKIECSVKIDDKVCTKQCKRVLKCGHTCLLRCYEQCKDCQEMVLKHSTCGHDIKVKCCEDAVRSLCNEKCSKILPCGHPCGEKCRDRCTTACKVMIKLEKPASCGHIFSVPCFLKNSDSQSSEILKFCTEPCNTMLICGHNCRGNCGKCYQKRIHVSCTEPCLTVFICGHACEKSCHEECGSCTRICELKCPHVKCNKICGEPCRPCKKPCSYGCKHKRCTKLCHEICDIEPCGEPCRNILKCGHYCIGFCGEPCPAYCRVCHKDELIKIVSKEKDLANARFVVLQNCNHIIKKSRLSRLVETQKNLIYAICCPECNTVITSCARIRNQIKQHFSTVTQIKKEFFYQSKNDREKDRKEYLALIKKMLNNVIMKELPQIRSIFQRLEKQCGSMKNRKNIISSFYEKYASEIILMILVKIIEYLDNQNDINTLRLSDKFITCKFIENQVKLLSDSIPTTLQMSKQRLEDIKIELRRLQLMIKLQHLFDENNVWLYQDPIRHHSVNYLIENLVSVERFSEILETKIITSSIMLKEIDKKNTLISEVDIPKKIGLWKGYWSKCAEGHSSVFFCSDEEKNFACPYCE